MSQRFLAARGKREEWPNITGRNSMEFTFDDVNIAPHSNTKLESRKSAFPYTSLGNLENQQSIRPKHTGLESYLYIPKVKEIAETFASQLHSTLNDLEIDHPEALATILSSALDQDDLYKKQGNDLGIREQLNKVNNPYQSLPGLKNVIPIMIAPMTSINDANRVWDFPMMEALSNEDENFVATLPRNLGKSVGVQESNFRDNLRVSEKLLRKNIKFIPTLGLNDSEKQAKLLYSLGLRTFMIDTAHGGQARIEGLIKSIKDALNDVYIIAGNIATYDGAMWYKQIGVDMAKVGIGPGSVCTTRLKTGVGVPQLSAVFDTTSAGIPVIADGGLKHPGDISKAIGAGASFAMIGGMLAGTDETPHKIGKHGEKIYQYNGQASLVYMEEHGHKVGRERTAEGISTTVSPKGAVSKILHDIEGGLRSAMSYVGAINLEQFQEKVEFVAVSPSAHLEGHPHFLQERKN